MATFSALGLPEPLLRAVDDLGFETPTPVQLQAIPRGLKSSSGLVVVAQTGTGKTAAFGLPLLARSTARRAPSGLVLAPTRELACQIADDLRAFAKHLPGVRVVTIYGGASSAQQISELRRGATIVVATPGRLVDLASSRLVDLSKIEIAVLDEADEILRMGFQDELNQIIEMLPPEHLTWLYSATMPPGVLHIAESFMPNHDRVDVGRSKTPVAQIDHLMLQVTRKTKYRALLRIIDANPNFYGIVFCRTRRDVQELSEQLFDDDVNTAALHGDLSQAQRDLVMSQFKTGRVKVLIATDIAARGLDVDDISHIIHFHLPDSFDAYTHRAGRTARAGKSGLSLLLIDPRDRRRAEAMARVLGFQWTHEELPSSADVLAAQVNQLHERFIADVAVDNGDLDDVVTLAVERFADLSREEIIRRICQKSLAPFLSPFRRRNFPPIQNHSARQSTDRQGPRQSPPSRRDRDNRYPTQENAERTRRKPTKQVRRDAKADTRTRAPAPAPAQRKAAGRWTVDVNAGAKHGLETATLTTLFAKNALGHGHISDIKVSGEHSRFEVTPESFDAALRAFRGFKLSGRRVSARRC